MFRTIKSIWVWVCLAFIAFLTSLFFDTQILFLIFRIKTLVLDSLLVSSTSFFTKGVIAVLAAALLFKKAKKKILPLVFAFLSSLVVVSIIKELIGRVRPTIALQLPELVESTTFSFPSGHATVAFLTLPFVFSAYPSSSVLRWVWLALIVFVCLSRVYLGLHYLSDIFAGALLGWFIGRFFLRFTR